MLVDYGYLTKKGTTWNNCLNSTPTYSKTSTGYVGAYYTGGYYYLSRFYFYMFVDIDIDTDTGHKYQISWNCVQTCPTTLTTFSLWTYNWGPTLDSSDWKQEHSSLDSFINNPEGIASLIEQNSFQNKTNIPFTRQLDRLVNGGLFPINRYLYFTLMGTQHYTPNSLLGRAINIYSEPTIDIIMTSHGVNWNSLIVNEVGVADVGDNTIHGQYQYAKAGHNE